MRRMAGPAAMALAWGSPAGQLLRAARGGTLRRASGEAHAPTGQRSLSAPVFAADVPALRRTGRALSAAVPCQQSMSGRHDASLGLHTQPAHRGDRVATTPSATIVPGDVAEVADAEENMHQIVAGETVTVTAKVTAVGGFDTFRLYQHHLALEVQVVGGPSAAIVHLRGPTYPPLPGELVRFHGAWEPSRRKRARFGSLWFVARCVRGLAPFSSPAQCDGGALLLSHAVLGPTSPPGILLVTSQRRTVCTRGMASLLLRSTVEKQAIPQSVVDRVAFLRFLCKGLGLPGAQRIEKLHGQDVFQHIEAETLTQTRVKGLGEVRETGVATART